MKKKYKLIIGTLLFFCFQVSRPNEEKAGTHQDEKATVYGEVEEDLFHACSDILIGMYEDIVSMTAVHFFQEIDEVESGLEIKVLGEIAQGCYKVSAELVKYGKQVLCAKRPLSWKAKRVGAILFGFFIMHQTMNNLSNRYKGAEKDKTVPK